jgi:hypothetical protein
LVRPPAIFLRTRSVLPASLRLKTTPFANEWMFVEGVAPAQLDLAVRDLGWHFMWIESACSRVGWGLSNEAAITRAIEHALMQTPDNCNAAELSFVRVSHYFGFHIANVTMYTRHIQQSASLGMLDGLPIPQLV